MTTIFRKRPELSRMKIALKLVYGSLELPAIQKRSVMSVANVVKIPYPTLLKYCRHWEETGKIRPDLRKKTGRNSKLKDIEAKLVDPVLLQEWGRYSSYERCIKIKQRFGVECSPSTLRRCYAKHKVGYRNTVEVKRRAKEFKEEFDQKRVVFA